MGVLFGFMLGYLFGTQAGHDGFKELIDAVSSISASGELKEAVTGAVSSIMSDIFK